MANDPQSSSTGKFQPPIDTVLAWTVTVVFFAVHLYLQIAKWHVFHPACFDYANVYDVLHSLLTGRVYQMEPTHLFGLVFSQTYFFFAPLFALVPSVYTLMVINSFVFSAGIILAYYAAREVFQRSWIPLLFTVSLALNPFYTISALSGFRPMALIVPAVFASFLAWRRKKKVVFVLVLALMCTAQLNILFGIFFLGFALWWRDRKPFFGLTSMAMSALWILASLIAAIIVTRQSGTAPPADIGHLIAYGSSFSEIFHTLLTRPGFVLKNIFYWKNLTIVFFFLTVAALPLLRPTWIAGAVPELIYIVLSTYGFTQIDSRTRWAVNLDDPLFSFFNTGLITVLPFLYVAAFEGLERLLNWVKTKKPLLLTARYRRIGIIGFLLFSCVIHYAFSPPDYGPVAGAKSADFSVLEQQPHHDQMRFVIANLKRDAFYLMDFSFFFYTVDFPRQRLLNAESPLDDTYDYIVLNRADPNPMLTPEQRKHIEETLMTLPYRTVWKSTDGKIVILARPSMGSPFVNGT